MEELLEKLRIVNKMLQVEGGFASGKPVSEGGDGLIFSDVAQVLADLMGANTYLIDAEGKLLGYSEAIDINNQRVKQMLLDRRFPKIYADEMAKLTTSTANIGIESDMTVFPVETRDIFVNGLTSVIPIFAAGRRLGSLIFARLETPFDSGDLILAEHSATVMGMEMLHLINVHNEEVIRTAAAVTTALRSLSYSEREAVMEIFRHIEGLEARINASRIAGEKGITRSVIVNALRKLESANIVETQSLGVKGTFIRILSPQIMDALKRDLFNGSGDAR